MSTAVAAIRRRRPLPTWVSAALLATLSVLIGLVSGMGGSAGQGGALFALASIALIVVIWKQPALSPIVVLLAALTVEQFPFTSGQPGSISMAPTPSDYTDRLPLFHGLGGGLHVSPADLLLLALLTIWMLKRETSETTTVPRSALTCAVGAVVLAAFVGLAVGQAHGGELRTALTEVRPYMYLGIAYLVATVFTTRLSVLHAAMWAIVLGSGFKAAQAFQSFLTVRNQIPRPDFIVGHEEALFFSLFMALTACLWIFQVPGRLRTTATVLFPLILIADLVNSRRAAWLILGGELIALTIVTMVAVPARRRFMSKVLALALIVSAVYFPAYWNHTGALAGPARAVKSAVAPNTRDESSDLYRMQENENLKLNIREGGAIGRGFGLPIDYAQGSITDISSIDPLIRYVPHNGVFYILMRMGLFGGIAFWSLLGVGILTGCRLVRSRNREVAVFGALLACGLVGYALEGYNDQGFFMYRIAFVIGTLLGLGEAARRLEARGDVLEAAPAAVPARARVASAPARRAPKPRARPVPVRAQADARSFDRLAQRLAVVLLPIAIGFFVWLVFAGAKTDTSAPFPVHPVQGRTTPRERPPTRAVVTPKSVSLVLEDVRTDSWVEIRQGSATGALVYSGVLRTGDRVALKGTRLWARFGGAGDLRVTANGRVVPLQGTIETVFTPGGEAR
jgi:RodZ C-terminal domain